VFKRFYRLEPSRRTAGNGLGLSLVAAVARLHGARIEMLDNLPGLRFRLLFPASVVSNSQTEKRETIAS
jgi:signal transduction histidine kinase